MTTRDFNGEGSTDLATTNGSSNNLSVLPGDGTGRFAAATTFAVGSNPQSVTEGSAVHVNLTTTKASGGDGDGTLDAIDNVNGSNFDDFIMGDSKSWATQTTIRSMGLTAWIPFSVVANG